MAYISQIKLSNTTYNISAIKLKNARTIQTNLASTSSASFDGTSNITPGVTGTLPISNGGTGASNRKTAITNLGIFGLYDRNDIGTAPNFDNPGVNGLFEMRSTSETSGETGTKPFNGFAPFISLRYSNTMFQLTGVNTAGFYIRGKQAGDPALTGVAWQKILTDSNWTDYAAAKSHSHSYLPLTGGTLTGNLYAPHIHIRETGSQYISMAMSGSGRFSFQMIPDTNSMRQHFRYIDNTTGYYNDFYLGDGETSLSSTAGYPILTTKNYTSYVPTKTGAGASGTWGINISGHAATATTSSNSNWLNTNSTLQYGASGLNYFNISGTAGSAANANQTPTADWYHIIRMNHANSNGYYTDIASCFHNNNMYMKRVASGSSSGWLHIWVQGNSVTGAVWNDYAECRESDCEDFGYVLMEVGDDSLTKTIERLSHFAGVSSDTWGFSQGETNKAKTPIAVAGRVLVYPYQDRNNYKPGDCVCAAPGGTVDIMTREEIREWPDRIVGTVSCVPNYEEWGGGEGADRDPVKVNGRIWIKVK